MSCTINNGAHTPKQGFDKRQIVSLRFHNSADIRVPRYLLNLPGNDHAAAEVVSRSKDNAVPADDM